MISTCKPMSIDHARRLAMAYELHQLLGEVCEEPGNGEGTPVGSALDLMGDVLEHLEPAAFDGTEPPPLGRMVASRAFQALATRRWRPGAEGPED